MGLALFRKDKMVKKFGMQKSYALICIITGVGIVLHIMYVNEECGAKRDMRKKW